MGKRIRRRLGGQVVILVRGGNLTSFVNMALGRGILLWDMRRSGEDLLSARVQAASVKELRHVAGATLCRFTIGGKTGPAFWWRRLAGRKALAAGFVAALLALYLLSNFVWSIRVEGNRQVPATDILQAAAGGGLTWGMPRWRLDPVRVEKAVRDALPEIAWVSLDLNGTGVRLEVVEKALPAPVSNLPADVVASRAGLIKEILVLKGRAKVAPGETVRPGQVLISGVVEPPAGLEAPAEPQLVPARGLVRARVWYEGYGEAHCVVTGERPAGPVQSRYSIKIGGREIISIGPGASPFPLYRTETVVKTFSGWRNIILPVEVVTTRYLQYEKFQEVRDLATARRLAAEKAFFDLESARYPAGTVVYRRLEDAGYRGDPLPQAPPPGAGGAPAGRDNVVRERMLVETLEDIGVERPLFPPAGNSGTAN